MAALRFLTWFIVGGLVTAHIAEAYTPPSIHHTLAVEIDPDSHRLTATDTIHLPKDFFNQTPLSFGLNPHLTVDRVEVNGRTVSVSKIPENPSGQNGFTQWMIEHPSINLEQSKPAPILTIDYHGLINDSPKTSGGLRFVRPDKTNGHIGPQGIYLTSETFWYPTWEQNLVTFDLALNLPSDWQAVTQGQETKQSVTGEQRISRWSISSPAEALTLAANHFVVQKKPWRDIQLATY
ncbi:MAG: hypothetical protein OET79_14145, partial [Nitrospirota bacterium]|nr:hypothetical protein [Nitrospirota bacterium]